MPTTKQLYKLWGAQFNLGLSNSEYYCQDHNPEGQSTSRDTHSEKFTGETIGTIRYNPKTKEMEIEFFRDFSKLEKSFQEEWSLLI